MNRSYVIIRNVCGIDGVKVVNYREFVIKVFRVLRVFKVLRVFRVEEKTAKRFNRYGDNKL